MKTIAKILAVLVLLSGAWAQDPQAVQGPTPTAPQKKTRPSHEHRGFFFSAGLGLAYTDVHAKDEDSDCCGAGTTETTRRDFSGWALPTMDFKFGKSIGNLVVLHALLDFALYSGEADYHYSKYYENEGVNLFGISMPKIDTKEKEGMETKAISVSWGLGLMVYPFRNPRSVMNGFYVGISGGMDFVVVGLFDEYNDFEMLSVFSQYEVGKDWWVSETWSIGFAFSFAMNTAVEMVQAEEGGDRGTFKFLIRLTRG